MIKRIQRLRRWLAQDNLIGGLCGLVALFASGALFATAASTFYYNLTWQERAAAYDRQVARLNAALDEATRETQPKLAAVVNRLDVISKNTERNTEQLEELLGQAGEAVTTAKGAAKTANTAAKNAAKSAAQTQIRVREVKPRAGLEVK